MLNQLDVAASDPRPTAHYSDGLLAATVNEGLEHIRHRFGEGHNPFDTVGLFADIVHAFAEIEAALRGPLGMLSEPSDLTGKTDVLREGLS